jgi:hypothetical protein
MAETSPGVRYKVQVWSPNLQLWKTCYVRDYQLQLNLNLLRGYGYIVRVVQ